MPLTATQSLKVAASTGASTRTGSSFYTFVVGWQIHWFDPSRRREVTGR